MSKRTKPVYLVAAKPIGKDFYLLVGGKSLSSLAEARALAAQLDKATFPVVLAGTPGVFKRNPRARCVGQAKDLTPGRTRAS